MQRTCYTIGDGFIDQANAGGVFLVAEAVERIDAVIKALWDLASSMFSVLRFLVENNLLYTLEDKEPGCSVT